jgi:hypothetical protein
MNEVVRLLLTKVFEAVYFSTFLIIGKDLKHKRLLLTLIMIFEYLMITNIIEYDVLFQLIYTFMSFVNLKVLYKEKAQVTDIFLFTAASVVLIFISIFSYLVIYFTINNYFVALYLNRILIIIFMFLSKNSIRELYLKFISLWNRHYFKGEIKSLTLRNTSIIIFNLMFWLINLGMIMFVKFFK